jgi:hypothetical protein
MKQLVALVGLTVLMAAPIVSAEVSDEQFQQLQDSLNQALDRIDELEKQQTTETAAQQTTKAATKEDASVADQVAVNTAKLSKMSWAERMRFQGDFRYRYQNEDISDIVSDPSLNETRNRNRIRARAALIAELDDDIEIGLGFASGGDDPVSTNQTLGGGGSTKDLNLDMAYFDWSGLENTHIRGGKFKNTFEKVAKSQLQWDGDWRPEGFDGAWDNGNFFAQGLGTYLESDSSSDNEFAYLLQAGGRAEIGGVSLVGGVGYTDIDAEGSACFHAEDDDQFCFGNQSNVVVTDPGPPVETEARYINDFQVYNVFAEAGFEVADTPLKLFADFIKNDAADDYDTGYLVGAQLGKAKKKGSWQVGYYYEDLESNATLGLLTNSDFGGGGTNGKGSVFSAGYALTDQASFKATYYLVDRNTDHIAAINNGEEFSVDILQLDLNFKYK